MTRTETLTRIFDHADPFDIAIIGGGATGLGIAVDAASRGCSVALFEKADFASGTSSRSTKLVHGGVRYLQQGNVSLVMEALRERGRLLRNAPHLVRDVPFIVPQYKWWESPFYGIGLRVYDLLAGKYGFGHSGNLSTEEVLKEIPSINTDGLRGGTRYYDGQFDDARLAINLLTTATNHGALAINYAPVTALRKDANAIITGLTARDTESGDEFTIEARVVINATGPFTDSIRQLDHANAKPIIAPSQGVHIVLPDRFLPGDSAIMVPHTKDGRVMFAIPWHDVVVVGTTDTPIDAVATEPTPLCAEIEFILDTANDYLSTPASPDDILSIFAGIRPLVREAGAGSTAAISRDHSIIIDPLSGLLTIAGGKWTTYRKMAEDAVDQALSLAGIDRGKCVTRSLPIHGSSAMPSSDDPLAFYGSDAKPIRDIAREQPQLAEMLHPDLSITGAQVAWACRNEAARSIDDVLSRRTRSLIFDAAGAIEAAPSVARIMGVELDKDQAWMDEQVSRFASLARAYLPDAYFD